ncbi:hypothetical protein N1851_031982 [Merluccius polli]|uniref:Uncharacterized protein n=1 Tax=Merluccius polli TaxID=89951 RepID=A0AA47M3J3_MERPO|nr:hypothetical protein N1851_031982 [Merluccius polli]
MNGGEDNGDGNVGSFEATLKHKQVEDGVLTVEDPQLVALIVSAGVAGLSFDQQKELLLLKPEHHTRGNTKVPIRILRDTGSTDSFICESGLPFFAKSNTGESIIMWVHMLKQDSELVHGGCSRGCRPIEGIVFILGNQWAGVKVWADGPWTSFHSGLGSHQTQWALLETIAIAMVSIQGSDVRLPWVRERLRCDGSIQPPVARIRARRPFLRGEGPWAPRRPARGRGRIGGRKSPPVSVISCVASGQEAEGGGTEEVSQGPLSAT